MATVKWSDVAMQLDTLVKQVRTSVRRTGRRCMQTAEGDATQPIQENRHQQIIHKKQVQAAALQLSLTA